MKQNRFLSPVVWASTLGVVLTQLAMINESGINWYSISVAVVTVVIAYLSALNNPTNGGGF